MSFVSHDPDGEPRAFELSEHPFFFASLFQPERSSLEGQAHPLITAFVEAVAARRACGAG